MRRSLWAAAAALAAAGCTGGQVPVAGKVTLDGRPLADATVHFQPFAPDKGSTLREAFGKTGPDGRYELKAIGAGGGAAVGKNRVRISLLTPPRKGEPQDGLVDRIPDKYKAGDGIAFDVPAGGTADANFDLESPAKDSR